MEVVAEALVPVRPSVARQAWTFTRHFLEMCISMCAGGGILAVVVFAGIPALLGGTDLRIQFPELSLIAIALLLTLPMATWMRFRNMEWRPILEMSAVPYALALVLIAAVLAGLAPAGTLQIRFGEFCGITCVGMFVVMLPRLGLYTGRIGHHAGHGAHAAHAG
jgi:hypothetical protein